MANKRKKVQVGDLRTNLFVRQGLNHDHAIHLGELIESGVKLPPIKITPENVVIDGRHRIEAYQLNDIEEIWAEIVEISDETEIIGMAFQANVGGPLPPNSKDKEHTIARLVELKVSNKRISEALGLPPSMTRTYVQRVKSRLNRAKLVRAAAAVTDEGKTVPQAAKEHGVPVDKLRSHLGGGRATTQKIEVGEIKKKLTAQFRTTSGSNAALLRGLLDKLEDGDVSANQVTEIFKHLQSLQRKAQRSVDDWEKRFKAMIAPKAA